MLLGILLTANIIVCVALIAVVLLQRSEGGALGMGGGPTGFMTARGAGDLLTRTTWILGSIFFGLSLLLTIVSGRQHAASSVVDRMQIQAIDPSKLNQPAAPSVPAPTAPAQTPGQAPGALEAPLPSLRNPLAEPATPAVPAPAAPSTTGGAPAQ